ncbi:hypothetical protein [Streptomyces sp. NPDC001851]|uniref:hypothetical protein n=1 Tax=Streptomyces sp. NPDC001851 TaxID=3154529 RepID=UPI003316CE7E
MTFHQNHWQLQGSKVYNIAGDLRLTEQSGPQEFAAVLRELRTRIGALESLSEPERADLDRDLAQADPTADGDGTDTVEGDVVAGRLTRIAGRLRALGGTAAAAVELGGAVESLAHFAGQHL